MKENIFNYLITMYNNLAFTHSYIFGYTMADMVYAAKVMDARAILPFILHMDKASSKNGGTIAIKYRQNAAKIAIIQSAAIEIKPICTVDYMEQLNAESKQNRGQLFENMVAKAFNMTQVTAKNAKFTDCGDVFDKDNHHYQVKFNKATFTDERTIHNLMGAE